MDNEITLQDTLKSEYKTVKALYKSAFPPEERPPFFIIRKKYESGKGKMLTVKSNNHFIGFAYLVCHRDMAYLFFLAISDDYRGKGYGSKVLKLLLEEYKGKKLFLAREELDENAENYEERVRRHSFYLRNGFTDLPYKLKEADVIYDVMSNGGMITPAEYDELITKYSGKLLKRLVDMRILDKNEH